MNEFINFLKENNSIITLTATIFIAFATITYAISAIYSWKEQQRQVYLYFLQLIDRLSEDMFKNLIEEDDTIFSKKLSNDFKKDIKIRLLKKWFPNEFIIFRANGNIIFKNLRKVYTKKGYLSKKKPSKN